LRKVMQILKAKPLVNTKGFAFLLLICY